MKNILFITSLIVVVLATGCKKSADKPAAQAAAQQLDKAQAATKDATQQMRDYTFAQKAEFVAAMQVQLAALNRDLDALAATIATSGAEVKKEATPKLAALREQAKKLDQQLSQVSNATSSTWSGIKADSEKAFAALKDGFAQSRQWVSDKIAP